MTETEHPQSASPQPRVSWSLSIPSLIYQAYNRRSKRVIAGSAAIVLLVLLNMYLARNRGLELYHQLQEKAFGFRASPPRHSFEETIREIWKPLKLPITAPNFTDQDGVVWELSRQPIWTHSLGKRVAIIDCDNRPFDDLGEIMYPHPLLWKDVQHLSAGMLSHYMYSLIHGYDYLLYRSPRYSDRGANWAKVQLTLETLRAGYEWVVFIDSDAQFTNPGVPLEWLFNRWNLTHDTAFSIAEEPDLDRDRDRFGKRGLNTGFYVARNEPRTHALLRAWAECPSRYPGCEEWRSRPLMEQTAFSEYVRYDGAFAGIIAVVPCNEANGYPDAVGETGCSGAFVRHTWLAKGQTKDWFAHSVMQAVVPQLHRLFVMDMERVVIDWRDKTLKGSEMLG